MFSAKPILVASALSLSAAAFVTAAPAFAGVVVKSSGPSAAQFPVGKKLADTDTITLRDGDAVTVLTDGGTRVIRGPGTHRVGARGASKKTAFAMLTRQTSGARVRTGAVRGEGAGPMRNTNLWNIDISRPGRFCVVRSASYDVWRPATAGEATYIFGSAVSDYEAQVSFADGEQTASLGADKLPLVENRIYDLSGPSGGASQRMEFIVLDAVPAEAEELAQVLARNGCGGQLELMADTLAVE